MNTPTWRAAPSDATRCGCRGRKHGTGRRLSSPAGAGRLSDKTLALKYAAGECGRLRLRCVTTLERRRPRDRASLAGLARHTAAPEGGGDRGRAERQAQRAAVAEAHIAP